MIPYGRQEITAEDIEAVKAVLQSDWLTQGPAVPRFEAALAAYCEAAHAVAVNSATSALHIACLALGLGEGDYVWTSPITFVASANCALYCGAKVDFVDIDPRTNNMSIAALKAKLAQAEKEGKLPKILIPVHLCGQSCDMETIGALARKHGFKVIEDAAHAIGGKYKDKPVGSCQYSDITVFSFHPVKIITTAEGGAAMTNDPALAKRMMLLRSHGITRNADEMENIPHGPWYYEQIALGYNYRMTDMQAALGVSQMNRLNAYVSKRHELADIYDGELAHLPVVTPSRSAESYSALHLYPVRLKLDEMPKTHREVFEAMREKGIGVNLHYIPVHLQPYYARFGFKRGDFPEAERYYSEAITLPLFPAMNDSHIAKVVGVLTEELRYETGRYSRAGR